MVQYIFILLRIQIIRRRTRRRRRKKKKDILKKMEEEEKERRRIQQIKSMLLCVKVITAGDSYDRRLLISQCVCVCVCG